MKSLFKTTLAAVALVTLLTATSHAALNATDDADNYTAWNNGDNFGTGFGAWILASSGTAGFFIGDSTNLNGGSGGDINVNDKSWGLFGAGGSFADAERFFTGTLVLGQTFTIDLAVNFRNGNKGINLRNDGDDASIFNFNIGSDDYVVNDATTGNGSIGNSYDANTAFRLQFTQTSAGGGTWSITRSGGISDFDTGTYTGVPASFKLYVAGTDGGSPNDLYANNIAIIPEPSTLMLVGCGLLGAWFVRRRKA
ncbi:MAG: hypothetical protein PCFJNLEI_01813 [Verrucomicrobiae bacterium]|nr:hypothetical protein [Verrucomicrobiae bacterium]